MSECNRHQLCFGPWEGTPATMDVFGVGGKPADVADFECPVCGLKLFIYYRTMPGEGATREHQQEGNTK